MIPEVTGRVIAEYISWALGWIYFFCWSASFYPQFLHNIRRKSVRGVAESFFPINVLGYVCYFVSTTVLLFSPRVRREYAERYPTAPHPTVRANDMAFACHALVLSTLTYSQFFKPIWGFEQGRKHEGVKIWVWGIFGGVIVSVLFVTALAGFEELRFGRYHNGTGVTRGWEYLDVTTAFSFSKLLITFVKYVPQAQLNYINKSTKGFSIWQMLLDFIGGALSIIQLFIDSALEGSWSGVKGNLTKLGLGGFSMFFDSIFIVQHYILYRQKDGRDQDLTSELPSESETESEAGFDVRSKRCDGIPSERTPLIGGSTV